MSGFDDFPDVFKRNTNYGEGVFRRRIRLTGSKGTVYGELEDCNHGFRVRVNHHAGLVTQILPEFPRIPFTSCDGAQEPLMVLLGCSIEQSGFELNMLAKPIGNCTHLLDLTILCITNAVQGDCTIVYDAEVSDQLEGVSQLKVHRNGELIHHWHSRQGKVIWPEALKGNTLFKGFAQWANEHFSGVENEAAFVLQKGNFVSLGRFVDVNNMVGSRASLETTQAACYTYSQEHAENAVRLPDTARDFTDTEEQLLKFL